MLKWQRAKLFWTLKLQLAHHSSIKIIKFTSVSRFQEKEKRGEMITINDNIK
jgi:hypothetical protein